MSLAITPVHDPSKILPPGVLRAQAMMPPGRVAMTPLKTLKLLLTPDILQTWFINPMNDRMAQQREQSPNGENHQIDVDEMWRFIGHRLSVAHPLFYHRIIKEGKPPGPKVPLPN